MLDLNYIARLQAKWVASMGWNNNTVLEDLALVCSEAGEAMNEARGEKPTKEFGSELADVILRTLNIAEKNGVNIEEEMLQKMLKNVRKGNYKKRLK